MNWQSAKIHESSLRPARNQEEYLLHQAALEWSLADCIVIQSAEDIQSRVNWRDRLEPFHHQVRNLFTFCRRLPVTLLADDVGLGKTISAGLILSELMARKRVTRAIVLCPKILCPQWVEELNAKFGIRGRNVVGEQLNDELAGGAPVVITTYESAADRLAEIKPTAFDMLILDEAHKLRNLHGGNKPPKLATSVYDALQRRLFKFVVMLTATPIQNRIWDIYSLMDCLTVAKGHQNPLGTPDQFKTLYLMPGSDGRRLHPPNAEAFRQVLRQYIVRTRRGDARLQFPTREVRLVRVDLSPQEQDLARLVARHIASLSGLQQTSLAQAMMSSPRALAAQLENMAQKQPSLLATAREARTLADACPEPTKLRKLLFLCEELRASRPDWRVVVFTHRKETQTMIGDALGRKGIPTGFIRGGEARQNQLAIERFWFNPPQIHVLVSTDAGAEGVNLQIANVLVNYDLPWNPMVVEQRIGRLQRLASEHGHVLIRNLVAAGSVEERVVARLMEKLQGIAQAIGDIESILESSEWDGDEDRFEDQIRDLVVKSLLGQDVERATRLAQESIDKALREIEENRTEIDHTLGRLDDLHSMGPSMPKLERMNPAMPARDFVLRSMRAEGSTVVESSQDVFEVRTAGRPHEVITFEETKVKALLSEAVFMGKVRLFEPGKPEFERLVQHWVDRCGHHICDLRRRTDSEVGRLARSWCEAIHGVEFLNCDVIRREGKFQGRVRVKVKVSNGVDAYEKLITGKFQPEGHQAVRETADLSDLMLEKVIPSQVLPDCLDPLVKTVEADRDVGEFCRFYEARRTEELSSAGGDPRLRHKVQEDFTPAVVADIVGVQGVRYDEVQLRVSFSVKGEGRYEADLLAVPISGQVLEEPETKQCQHTGLRVPVGCLDRCQLTGKLVLKHLLDASEVSGRRGLRDLVKTCQVTGKKAFDDEVARSAASGILAVQSELVRCHHTNDLLLPDETGKSAASGKVVRKDLLVSSEKPPGRLGLSDEFSICESTRKRLLLDELNRSVVSNKLVDCDLLKPSDRSGRLALAEELVTCQESGAWLLPEETAVCVLTGKRVDLRLLGRSEVSGASAITGLLAQCAESGKLALPAELQTCEVTGSQGLPEKMAVCAVTGKRALRSRMVICQHTGEWILSSEAGKSNYSDKLVRRDLLKPSESSPARQGLPDEFGICEVTGKRLLLDELDQSTVSGRLVDKNILRQSARSGAAALPEEMVTCQESGAELLPAEVGHCEITGNLVDSQLLTRSEVSGIFALSRLLERCAATGKLCLPSELVECEMTGSRVLPSELDACSVTGKRILKTRLIMCSKTRQPVFDAHVGRSAVSGLVVRKDLLRPSEKSPHRLGLAEEISTCQVTGRKLLLDETDVSAATGKRVDRSLLIPSARSGKVALATELLTCEESGARILPVEAARCSVTGKLVDDRLLSISEHSGRVALTRLTKQCAVTGKLALAEELERCDLSGELVLPSQLKICAVTGKRGIRGKMARSHVSGKYVIPQKAVRSAVSGKTGLPEEAVRCAWLERPILREEAKGCNLTRRVVSASLLNEEGELASLRDLLDGRARDAVSADDLVPRIRSLDEPFFRGLKHVWIVKSPKGGKFAVCGEMHSWLGLKVRFVGFLLKAAEDFEITGQGVLGYRDGDCWQVEQEVEFG